MNTLNRNAISALIILICCCTRLPAEEGKVYDLSIAEATRLALVNNFDIQLARYDAWIERTQIKSAESIYDTIINGEAQYRRDKKKRTTTITGTEVLDNDYNVGVSKKLPTGTTLSTDLRNHRNASDAFFAVQSPVHESTLAFTLEQDLGRNFFGIQDRGDVKLTKIEVENTEYTSLDRIESQLAETQKAYWALALATERLKIAEGMSDQARKLYELNNDKLKDGLVEMPEALASEANYYSRLNEVNVAKNEVAGKANALRLLLNITDDHVVIRANENFIFPSAEEAEGLSLKHAFENRQDYKRALNVVEGKNLQLVLNRKKIWPEINLVASLARNGLGAHFPKAVQDISEEDNPEYFLGLKVSFPLENNKAESQAERAKLEKAKALLELKLLERKISIEIMDQVRTCNILREVTQTSRQVADLQDRKLQEEEKQFSYGRSDTDTIVRFQEDVLQARFKAAQDNFDYQSSLIDLRKNEGMLLGKYWEGEL